MSKFVLDSSAILAVVNEEDGAESVRALLDEAAISAVNAAEVFSKLHEYSDEAVETTKKVLQFVEIVPFDVAQAERSGELRAMTKKAGLSLGDRACIALGMQLGLAIYTTDAVWGNLGLPCDIRLLREPRKSVQ